MNKVIRHRLLKEFDYKCVKCGSKEKLEIDHIIPISRNGKENENNMQVLCKTCNLKKGKSLDINKYFRKGDGKNFIFVSKNLPLNAFTSNEFIAILKEKIEELCEYER